MESVVDGNGGGSRLVMTELSHIKELVNQLDVHLGGCPELCKHLAAQIFAVTERSIGMIRSGNIDGLKRSAGSAGLDSPPFSATPSPLSGVSDMPLKANKRKRMVKGKCQVRVSSAGGGAVDDGFSWRKYGQKEILGSPNPRGYYRCTYQKTQGCAATKQVQRVDEDPTLFDVTYHGTHTCVHHNTVATAAANVQSATPNPDAHSLLQSLSSGLTVNTEGLTSGPQQSTPFSFSSPAVSSLTPQGHYPSSTPSTPENCFGQGVTISPSRLELSPATSESSYSPMNPFEAEWRAESELQKMVSALVAAASMPESPVEVEETSFSLDGLELLDFEPNFDVSIFLL
uniref:Uncharacterized protein n=1 Tax=Avena sativa TaxID=4498 RepID=A0ACD5Y638_AVESA